MPPAISWLARRMTKCPGLKDARLALLGKRRGTIEEQLIPPSSRLPSANSARLQLTAAQKPAIDHCSSDPVRRDKQGFCTDDRADRTALLSSQLPSIIDEVTFPSVSRPSRPPFFLGNHLSTSFLPSPPVPQLLNTYTHHQYPPIRNQAVHGLLRQRNQALTGTQADARMRVGGYASGS